MMYLLIISILILLVIDILTCNIYIWLEMNKKGIFTLDKFNCIMNIYEQNGDVIHWGLDKYINNQDIYIYELIIPEADVDVVQQRLNKLKGMLIKGYCTMMAFELGIGVIPVVVQCKIGEFIELYPAAYRIEAINSNFGVSKVLDQVLYDVEEAYDPADDDPNEDFPNHNHE